MAFTGHRTYDGRADARLAAAVHALYAAGMRIFYSGMAVGFDLAAAEAVVALRQAHAEVKLVCAVPFRGQERRYPPSEQVRYRALLAAADAVEYLAEGYLPGCYARRNDFLVDHAGVLVAWYDGSAGGTRYTVARARRAGVPVRNLWQDAQPELPGL